MYNKKVSDWNIYYAGQFSVPLKVADGTQIGFVMHSEQARILLGLRFTALSGGVDITNGLTDYANLFFKGGGFYVGKIRKFIWSEAEPTEDNPVPFQVTCSQPMSAQDIDHMRGDFYAASVMSDRTSGDTVIYFLDGFRRIAEAKLVLPPSIIQTVGVTAGTGIFRIMDTALL